MKRALKGILSLCLLMALLVGASNGVSAATATSVWVNGIEMTDGDYLASNSASAVTAGAATEPAGYVAWFHNGTLTLNNAAITNGYTTLVGYKTGPCGIYANGDLALALKGENQIKNDTAELSNGIVVEGNLTLTSSEDAVMNVFTKYFGIYSAAGNITISGAPTMQITNDGDDMSAKGAIFACSGDIIIKDYVTINALLRDGEGDGASATINAYNGNISISDYASVSVESHDCTGFGCGLCAKDSNSAGNGNITFSGNVSVYAMGHDYGIYVDNNINIGNNSLVSVEGGEYGIYGIESLTINRGCLEVVGGSGAFGNAKDNRTLNGSYLAMAYSNEQMPLTTSTELAKISYQAGSVNNYVYNNDPSYGVHYFLFRPNHDCESFSDCANWGWAAPYNCFVIENKIMGSVNADSKYFDSNGTVNRAMVVAVMYRLCGSPALTDADYAAYNNKFTDVAKGKWYYNAVVWAYNNKVAAGITDTSFAPEQNTSREQIVTFFWRFCDYLNYDNSGNDVLGKYSDLSAVDNYAVNAFKWSVTYGIVSGTSDATLSPKDPCTRGEMATIINLFAMTFMDNQNWVNIRGL